MPSVVCKKIDYIVLEVVGVKELHEDRDDFMTNTMLLRGLG